MKRSLPLLMMLLLLPLTTFGQASPSWIGQRVITHFGAVLKVGNEVVDDENRGTNLAVSGHDRKIVRVYLVEQVNGDWLWLKAEKEGAAGWVKADYAIPYGQAIDYFTKQIRANPDEAAWYLSRGIIWDEKGEYDIAIADYNEAIRLDPSDGEAWNNRGLASRNKKDYDKAIADFSEAIRLDPKHVFAWNNLGLAWDDKKDYDKAIASFNEAIRLDPKDASAYNNRGHVWKQKNDFDKAIADYHEAIRLDPKHVSAYYNRGNLWAKKNDHDKAIADYDEAIRLNPKDARAYNNRAWLRATCPDQKYRDGRKAYEDASEACQLDNYKEANILGTLAAAYAECGDFDKAVEWQEKANKMYTDAAQKQEGEERLKLYKDEKAYGNEP